jgi:hypothetical protein
VLTRNLVESTGGNVAHEEQHHGLTMAHHIKPPVVGVSHHPSDG